MRATKYVLLGVVLVTGWSFGQPPAEKPKAEKAEGSSSRLEELLATALRHSPDVQVAEAKVREAEAELRRTRLTLLQKVIEAHLAVEAQKTDAAAAEAKFRRMAQMRGSGVLSTEEYSAAESLFAAAKARLA